MSESSDGTGLTQNNMKQDISITTGREGSSGVDTSIIGLPWIRQYTVMRSDKKRNDIGMKLQEIESEERWRNTEKLQQRLQKRLLLEDARECDIGQGQQRKLWGTYMMFFINPVKYNYCLTSLGNKLSIDMANKDSIDMNSKLANRIMVLAHRYRRRKNIANGYLIKMGRKQGIWGWNVGTVMSRLNSSMVQKQEIGNEIIMIINVYRMYWKMALAGRAVGFNAGKDVTRTKKGVGPCAWFVGFGCSARNGGSQTLGLDGGRDVTEINQNYSFMVQGKRSPFSSQSNTGLDEAIHSTTNIEYVNKFKRNFMNNIEEDIFDRQFLNQEGQFTEKDCVENKLELKRHLNSGSLHFGIYCRIRIMVNQDTFDIKYKYNSWSVFSSVVQTQIWVLVIWEDLWCSTLRQVMVSSATVTKYLLVLGFCKCGVGVGLFTGIRRGARVVLDDGSLWRTNNTCDLRMNTCYISTASIACNIGWLQWNRWVIGAPMSSLEIVFMYIVFPSIITVIT